MTDMIKYCSIYKQNGHVILNFFGLDTDNSKKRLCKWRNVDSRPNVTTLNAAKVNYTCMEQ